MRDYLAAVLSHPIPLALVTIGARLHTLLGLDQARRRFTWSALGLLGLGALANMSLAVVLDDSRLAVVSTAVMSAVVLGTVFVGRRELAAAPTADAVQLDVPKLVHNIADPLTVLSGYCQLLVVEAES